MAEDTLFSGESKNVEYKITVPEKSEKYMKTVVAFANGRGGKIVFGIDACEPAIARAFAYMKIIEKWGTGIPRLFEACEEYGLPKPELVDFDGDFRVNMYRKVESVIGFNGVTTQATQGTTQATQGTTQAELSEDDKAVLMSIAEDPDITQKEMAAKLDWKIDRVKYYLNKLKRKGIVKRVGTSQNGHWEVVAEEIKWQS